MAEITRDTIHGLQVDLDSDEVLRATLSPDLAAFWRANGIMALALGVVAGAALVYQGNPDPWVGPVAAALAMGARAAYIRSEAMAEVWRLTNRRLLGPGGRIVPLSSLKLVRPFLGAVQLVTQAGDKHLIKYQADAVATVAAIDGVRVRG
jgi:hypothetical protein